MAWLHLPLQSVCGVEAGEDALLLVGSAGGELVVLREELVRATRRMETLIEDAELTAVLAGCCWVWTGGAAVPVGERRAADLLRSERRVHCGGRAGQFVRGDAVRDPLEGGWTCWWVNVSRANPYFCRNV